VLIKYFLIRDNLDELIVKKLVFDLKWRRDADPCCHARHKATQPKQTKSDCCQSKWKATPRNTRLSRRALLEHHATPDAGELPLEVSGHRRKHNVVATTKNSLT